MPEPSIPRQRLYPVNRRYLGVLSTDLGVWQHAQHSEPDPNHGYCTDDVSRALSVDLMHGRHLGWDAVAASVGRHIAFLQDAEANPGRRFRNFRAADGAWLEDEGSEDSHGRAMIGLANAMVDVEDGPMREIAGRLFMGSLPAARALRFSRARASALIACDRAIDAGAGAMAEATFGLLTDRLATLFRPVFASPEWPWPEPTLTYENALLPRALIVAGRRTGDASLLAGGLKVLDWLIDGQTNSGGSFSPVGNKSWWPRGGEKSQFDQQPIEAAALILACTDALTAGGDERYVRGAEMAYGWFLGENDLSLPVAAPLAGACHDGLMAEGLNLNQGAESTLAWLLSLEQIRRMRASRNEATEHAPEVSPSATGTSAGSRS